jgi:hypothetical protein
MRRHVLECCRNPSFNGIEGCVKSAPLPAPHDLSPAVYYHSACCSREKFPEIDWVQIFVPQSGGAVFSFIDRGRLEGFGALASSEPPYVGRVARREYTEIATKSEAAI